MKQKLPFLLLLTIIIFSCNTNNKTPEQLRVECDSLLNLASSTLKAGFQEVAVSYCNQAISIDSTYWKNHCTKGLIFYYGQNYDSAVIALDKTYHLLGQKTDTMLGFMYYLSYSYQKVKRYDEALMIAQKGLINFKEAISKCSTRPTRIAVIGDSYIEGDIFISLNKNMHNNYVNIIYIIIYNRIFQKTRCPDSGSQKCHDHWRRRGGQDPHQ